MLRLHQFETFNATFVQTGHPCDVLVRMISVSGMARRSLFQQLSVHVSNTCFGEEVAVNVFKHLTSVIFRHHEVMVACCYFTERDKLQTQTVSEIFPEHLEHTNAPGNSLLALTERNQADMGAISLQHSLGDISCLQLAVADGIVDTCQDPLTGCHRSRLGSDDAQLGHAVKWAARPEASFKVHQQLDASTVADYVLMHGERPSDEGGRQGPCLRVSVIIFVSSDNLLKSQLDKLRGQGSGSQLPAGAALRLDQSLQVGDLAGCLKSGSSQGFVVLQNCLAFVKRRLPDIRRRQFGKVARQAQEHSLPFLFLCSPFSA